MAVKRTNTRYLLFHKTQYQNAQSSMIASFWFDSLYDLYKFLARFGLTSGGFINDFYVIEYSYGYDLTNRYPKIDQTKHIEVRSVITTEYKLDIVGDYGGVNTKTDTYFFKSLNDVYRFIKKYVKSATSGSNLSLTYNIYERKLTATNTGGTYTEFTMSWVETLLTE